MVLHTLAHFWRGCMCLLSCFWWCRGHSQVNEEVREVNTHKKEPNYQSMENKNGLPFDTCGLFERTENCWLHRCKNAEDDCYMITRSQGISGASTAPENEKPVIFVHQCTEEGEAYRMIVDRGFVLTPVFPEKPESMVSATPRTPRKFLFEGV